MAEGKSSLESCGKIEPRMGRAMIPSTVVFPLGEYVPLPLVIDQLVSTDEITIREFFTLVFLAQNGQVESPRVSSDVKSMYPSPPIHAPGSFSGSAPEKEKRHCLAFRSISTNRFRPGQFES